MNYEDYVFDLVAQLDGLWDRSTDLAEEEEHLWHWLHDPLHTSIPGEFWVVDVRVGGLSPEYDRHNDRYYEVQIEKEEVDTRISRLGAELADAPNQYLNMCQAA